MLRLVPCLADVGRARPELQQAFELGVLVRYDHGLFSLLGVHEAERGRRDFQGLSRSGAAVDERHDFVEVRGIAVGGVDLDPGSVHRNPFERVGAR
jgi:hypothetical protein